MAIVVELEVDDSHSQSKSAHDRNEPRFEVGWEREWGNGNPKVQPPINIG
jgi:hypothetical protein